MKLISQSIAMFAIVFTFVIARSDAQEPRLHFLGIADTEAEGVGPHVEAALFLVASAVLEHLPTERKQEHPALIGPQCNIQSILKSAEQLAIPPNDTLVVYYAGHGGIDAMRRTQLLPQRDAGNALPLRTLIEALESKRPRLLIMLIDCCQTPVAGQEADKPKSLANQYTTQVQPLELSLFFEPGPGTILVFATEREQPVPCGIPTDDGKFTNGTLFSEALAYCSRNSREAFGWKSFGLQVKQRVNQNFQKHRRDTEGRLILSDNQRVSIPYQHVWAQMFKPNGQAEYLVRPK